MGRFSQYKPISFDVPEFVPDFAQLREIQDLKQKRLDDFNNQTDMLAASLQNQPGDEAAKQLKIKDIMDKKDLVTKELINNPANGTILLKRFQSDLKKDVLSGDIYTMNKRKADYDARMQQIAQSAYGKDPRWRKHHENLLKQSYGDFYTDAGFGKTEGSLDEANFFDEAQKIAFLQDFTNIAPDLYQEEIKKDPSVEKLGYTEWYKQVTKEGIPYSKLMSSSLGKYMSNGALQSYWKREGEVQGLEGDQSEVRIFGISDLENVERQYGQDSPEYKQALSKVGKIDNSTLAGAWIDGALRGKETEKVTQHYTPVVNTKAQQDDQQAHQKSMQDDAQAHDMKKLQIQLNAEKERAQLQSLEALKELSKTVGFTQVPGGTGKIDVPSHTQQIIDNKTKQSKLYHDFFLPYSKNHKDGFHSGKALLDWQQNTKEGREWASLSYQVNSQTEQLKTAVQGTSLDKLLPGHDSKHLEGMLPKDSEVRSAFLDALSERLTWSEAVKKYPILKQSPIDRSHSFTWWEKVTKGYDAQESNLVNEMRLHYEEASKSVNSLGVIAANHDKPQNALFYKNESDQKALNQAVSNQLIGGSVKDINGNQVTVPAGFTIESLNYTVNAANPDEGHVIATFKSKDSKGKEIIQQFERRVSVPGLSLSKDLYKNAHVLGTYDENTQRVLIQSQLLENQSSNNDLSVIAKLNSSRNFYQLTTPGLEHYTVHKVGDKYRVSGLDKNKNQQFFTQDGNVMEFDNPTEAMTEIVKVVQSQN